MQAHMRRFGRNSLAFIEQEMDDRTGRFNQERTTHSTPMPQQRFSNLITPPRRPTATVILPSATSVEYDQRRVRFPEGHTVTLRYDANAPVSSRPSSQQGSHPPTTRSNLALDFVLNLEDGHFSDTTADGEGSSSDHGSDFQEDALSSLQTDITYITTEEQLDSIPERRHRRRPISLPVPDRRHPSQEHSLHHTHISHARRRTIVPSRWPYAPRHNGLDDDDRECLISSKAPPGYDNFQQQASMFPDVLSEDGEFHNGDRVASPSNSSESSASDEPIFAMDGIYECTERPGAIGRFEEPGRFESAGRSHRASRPNVPERHQPSLESIPERDAFIPGHRHAAPLTSSEFKAFALSDSAASQRPTRPNHGQSTNQGKGNSAPTAPRRSNLTSSLARLNCVPSMTPLISRPTQTAEVASVASVSRRILDGRQRHSAPPAPRTSHTPYPSAKSSGPRHATRASVSVSTAGSGWNSVFHPTSYSSQQAFSPEEIIYHYSTSNDRILNHRSQTMFEYQPYNPPSSSSVTRPSPRSSNSNTTPPPYTPRREQLLHEPFEERSSQGAHRAREPISSPRPPSPPSSTARYSPTLGTLATSPSSITPRRRPLSEQLSSQMPMMRTRPNARNRSGLLWDTPAALGFPQQIPWQGSAPQLASPPQQQPAVPRVPPLRAARRLTAPPRPSRPPFDPTLTPFTPSRDTSSRTQSQPPRNPTLSHTPASRPWLVNSNTASSFSPSSSSSKPYKRLPESILAAFPQIPSTIPPPQPCGVPSGSVPVPPTRSGPARASLPESPTLGAVGTPPSLAYATFLSTPLSAASGSRSVRMQIAAEDQLQDGAAEASSNAGQANQASKNPNRLSLKNPFKNVFNGNFFKKKDKGVDKGKWRKE